MTGRRLAIATEDYDRIQALRHGRIRIDGFELDYQVLKPKDLFNRIFRSQEFDVTEISFSSYMLNFSRGEFPYQALPIFLSRVFPHGSIYIRRDGGITTPLDLKGRIVGVPNWNFTRGLVTKGMLKDEYGIQLGDVRWVVGPVDSPEDSTYSVAIESTDVQIECLPPGRYLAEELIAGRVDAIINAYNPKIFTDGHNNVTRLFPDFRPVEQSWFKRTGIFPTMHLVAIRKTLLSRYPSLALDICRAFNSAKVESQSRLLDLDALAVVLPWVVAEAEATEQLMGKDYWPYGVDKNRTMIEAQARWSFEQGLSSRLLATDELFAKSTLDWNP